MNQIVVHRWLLWAAALWLVAWFPLSFLFQAALGQPVGTSWNLTPLFVIIALFLLLASVAAGRGVVAAQSHGAPDAPPHAP